MKARTLFLGAVAMIACLGWVGPARANRILTDMAGQTVVVPDTIRRVVTVGPVPVLNSFVFALGEAASLVNGLPPNLGGPRWKYQYVIAPGLRDRPIVQGAEGAPAIEPILALTPDIVLTMDVRTQAALQQVGVPVMFLAWRQPDDAKALMRLLGKLFGKTETAEAYCRYFDATLARTAAVPGERRPRVLYANLHRLTQPHLIAEWWIAKAGGQSVTDDGRTAESLTFSLEQLLAWDPELLIVGTPAEAAEAYADPRLAGVAAIRARRVFAIPMGAHLWGNRTVEQPLTVLWAAKLIHPERFADLDLGREIAGFYASFFQTALSPAMVDEILAGRVGF